MWLGFLGSYVDVIVGVGFVWSGLEEVLDGVKGVCRRGGLVLVDGCFCLFVL